MRAVEAALHHAYERRIGAWVQQLGSSLQQTLGVWSVRRIGARQHVVEHSAKRVDVIGSGSDSTGSASWARETSSRKPLVATSGAKFRCTLEVHE